MNNAPGDDLLAPGEFYLPCDFERPRYRQGSEVCDGDAIHFYCQALGAETLAMTRRALCRRHVFHQPVAVTFWSRFFERLPQVSENYQKACSTLSLLAINPQILNFVLQFLDRICHIVSIRRS